MNRWQMKVKCSLTFMVALGLCLNQVSSDPQLEFSSIEHHDPDEHLETLVEHPQVGTEEHDGGIISYTGSIPESKSYEIHDSGYVVSSPAAEPPKRDQAQHHDSKSIFGKTQHPEQLIAFPVLNVITPNYRRKIEYDEGNRRSVIMRA